MPRCLVLLVVLVVGTACARLTTTRPTETRLTPTDTLAVWLEFDKVPLTPLFLAAFREQGLPVATSKETAQVLLTGAYSADWDLIHWRFQWSQLRLMRPQTGEVLMLLETGQGGLGSVEAVVQRMVKEICDLVSVSWGCHAVRPSSTATRAHQEMRDGTRPGCHPHHPFPAPREPAALASGRRRGGVSRKPLLRQRVLPGRPGAGRLPASAGRHPARRGDLA